jgi:hypothetical protein
LTDSAFQILRDTGLPEKAAVQTFTTTYLILAGWLATRNLAEAPGIHPSLAAAGAGALADDGDQPLIAAIRSVLTAAEGQIT